MNTTTRRIAPSLAACALVLVGTATTAAAAPDDAGCAAFGANVATLARTLGGDFGATASGVASSAPGAFPEFVVHPEQASLCQDGPRQ